MSDAVLSGFPWKMYAIGLGATAALAVVQAGAGGVMDAARGVFRSATQTSPVVGQAGGTKPAAPVVRPPANAPARPAPVLAPPAATSAPASDVTQRAAVVPPEVTRPATVATPAAPASVPASAVVKGPAPESIAPPTAKPVPRVAAAPVTAKPAQRDDIETPHLDALNAALDARKR